MEEKPMKPIDWAITLFVVNLPLIGIIMLFVWAFGNQDNQTREQDAKGDIYQKWSLPITPQEQKDSSHLA